MASNAKQDFLEHHLRGMRMEVKKLETRAAAGVGRHANSQLRQPGEHEQQNIQHDEEKKMVDGAQTNSRVGKD